MRKNFGRFLIFASLLLLSLTSLAALIPQHALAATGAWIDAAHIKVGEEVYTDSKVGDSMDYKVSGECKNEIKGFNNDYFDNPNFSSATLYNRSTDPRTGVCNEAQEHITLSNPGNAKILFNWIDAETIESVFQTLDAKGQDYDQAGGLFKSLNHTAEMLEAGGDKCKSSLNVNSNATTGTLIAREPAGFNDECVDRWQLPVTIGATDKRSIPAGQGQSQYANSTDGSGTDEDNSCESRDKMGWIMCPVIEILDGAFNWLDRTIQAILEVNRDSYESSKLHNVWAQMRNIAFIVLVPMMLVMVIGTAMGFDIFDAYTVKRALPRMVIAVIFISLSWYICLFLISVSNAVGTGILGLMTSPFGLSGSLTLGDLFDPSFGGFVAQVGGVALFVKLILVFKIKGILGIILSFAAAGLFVMAMAFLVLVLRQLFILLLVIASPLAILAWIFPGNDKIWKDWWGSFSKLLIMFPLIMSLIAAGRIFAYLIGNTPSAGLQGGLLNPLLKIAAYILPYAFIPFTFKFAGGLFATVAGMANDRSKGIFDRLRKGRQQRYERAGREILQKRVDKARSLQEKASGVGMTRVRSGLYRGLARGIGGGHNFEAQASARTAAVAKELNDQIATGRDDDIRGLTVNKKAIDAMGWENALAASRAAEARGDMANVLVRVKDGKKQYKSLGGGWVDEANVLEGHRRWGNDTYAQQAALSYEMRKAMTDDQVAGISQRYADVANDQWRMTEQQAGGAWIGSAFENQNQHIEFKHTNWKNGELNVESFANEIYEKKGSYPLAQMSAHTFDRLKHAYDQGDAETKQKIQAVAETFMTRYGGGGAMAAADPDNPEVIAAIQQRQREILARGGTEDQARAAAQQIVQTNTAGAAHVAEAARDLAVHVGVYKPLDPATSDVGPAGPPPSPRQH